MNKLDQLRTMTEVVADTGDIEAIAKYRPTDATTNPSLLLKAAQLPAYDELITESVNWVKSIDISDEDKIDVLADKLAVSIGCEILKLIPGRISTEVDAHLSFDTEASVKRAHRIMAFYDDAGVSPERVLIKLASTWEGIRAAEILEKEGIQCNLTLLFSSVQAVAAADAGAFLISPFVGRILDWYKNHEKVDGYATDDDPGVLSVRDIYALYKDRGYETVVMGASFRNAGQIEGLAGCDRLTIGPKFLEELQADTGKLERVLSPDLGLKYNDCTSKNEADFRLQFNESAMATEKLSEGIRLFVADQNTLKSLLSERLFNT